MARFALRLPREIPVDRVESRVSRSAALSAAGNLLLTPFHLDPERDADDIATAGFSDLANSPAVFGLPLAPTAVRETLSEVSDGRLFHPDFIQPAKTVRGSRSSMKPTPQGVGRFVSPVATVQFSKAAHVIICVRRHARRAALLAQGSGGAHFVERRRKPDSDTRC